MSLRIVCGCRTPKVYLWVPLFNEIDILRIKLELLWDVVDYFVIGEMSTTFNGHQKPLVFEEVRSLFGKFSEKIIYAGWCC